jgi:hypothetical protein
MRFNVFISLLVIALILDIALLTTSLAHPGTRLFVLPAAIAASQSDPPPAAPSEPTPTSTPRPVTPTTAATTASAPQAAPSTSPTPSPSATATATVAATVAMTVTMQPAPRLLADKRVSFTPGDKAVRANITLALAHYYGALTHVVLPPGAVFSFNATLGLRPQRMPWKNVKLKPTAAPALAEPDEAAPTSEPEVQLIQGGGLCDLASRFVMAARPLLPARAFHFVNHVKSNGIHLSGVPARDSVSIWAIGGGSGEQDLRITNLTEGWLEFVVDRDGDKITVTARLWDRAPPGW